MDKRALIASLIEKRKTANAAFTGLADLAVAENRKLDTAEQESFDRLEAEIREFDERVTELDAQVRADDAAADMAKRYAPVPAGDGVQSEPSAYRSGQGGKSYFRDLHTFRKNGDFDARERLVRNNREVLEKRTGVTTTTVTDFVPPLWLMDKFVTLARAGRITANLVPNFPLPQGTDSLNIPKVATGTATASQTTQNTAVNETDITTTSVSSGITTIAGGQVVSLQTMTQSPLNIDDIVLQDLAADYAVKLNTQVIKGAGTSGDQTGILTLTGTNAVAVSTAVTAVTLYSAVANAIQLIHTSRFLPPDCILMTPARWAWLTSQVDSANRPLVTPAANSPQNAYANQGEVVSQGYAGTMQGLPVYLDAIIPGNLGASGAAQDTIIVARLADLMLWEGNLQAETFEQTYANQLSVYIRLYNFCSFQAARYPKSISVIGGAGMAGPTF